MSKRDMVYLELDVDRTLRRTLANERGISAEVEYEAAS